MNDRFFSLPEKKQLAVINAGYRVFSHNSYKKSPMSEIAAEAGISKSLLFHYFLNKRELYLFLLKNAAETTYKYLYEFQCYDGEDIFEIMHRGLKAKASLMRKYTDLTLFTLKAYYETDSDIREDVQKIIGRTVSLSANTQVLKIDSEKFVKGLNLEMMYNDMYLASEGYLWEKSQQGKIDVDMMEKDFKGMIDFWKEIYLRKE